MVSFVVLSFDGALAAFPGGNGLLAFSNYDPGNLTGQVSTVTAEEDGTVDTLTSEGLLNDLPAWSADGTRLAFYSNRDGNSEIYVMEADGSQQTRLTDDPAFDYIPVWVSDGLSLLFASDRDGDFEIYRMSVTGGVPRQLTHNTADDLLAVVSPGCDRIAFVSNRDGDDEIFVMDLYGQDQTQLTFNSSADLYPDWSPDGLQMAFASEREGSMGRDIWIMDDDGSEQDVLIGRAGHDSEPAFSPDGKMVAWSTDSGGGLPRIEMTPLNNLEAAVTVSEALAKDQRQPDWQPIEPDDGPAAVDCAPLIICGDATEDFDITASDALHILRAAVGHPIACIRPRCDTDDNESIVATDAQRVLRYAVAQAVTLECPLPSMGA